MMRACIDCGRPASGTRCTVHAKAAERRRGSPSARGSGRDYQSLRLRVLGEESACWLCGKPARLGDPLTVDHVLPLALRGAKVAPMVRAAHRSCNSRRGGSTRGAEVPAKNRLIA